MYCSMKNLEENTPSFTNKCWYSTTLLGSTMALSEKRFVSKTLARLIEWTRRVNRR